MKSVVLGGILACLMLLLLIIVSTILYFWARRRFAHSKFFVEVLFIGVAILVSIGVKIAVLALSDQQNDLFDGGILFLRALYSGVGGLTFANLEPYSTTLSGLLICFYYGTSAYAGLMMLIVIPAKVSYEFYSMVYLVGFNLRKRKDIFVFTDLTEETLCLARDIKHQSSNDDKKSIIVFAGPTICSFDKQNELCREVVSEGFLYWSYAKNKRKSKSIAAVLHTERCNGHCSDVSVNGNKSAKAKRFVVFAFASHNHIPAEEENLDIVFDDISTRIKQKDSLLIEYYLLTKREVNYQSYIYKNREMMLENYLHHLQSCTRKNLHNAEMHSSYVILDVVGSKAFGRYFLTGIKEDGYCEEWSKIATDIMSKYAERFMLNVWCEASAIGTQTLQKMFGNGFADYLATNNDGLRVWTLGFGTTGQAITSQLFVNSANVHDGKSRDFLVDVYDSVAGPLGGIYSADRPDFLCTNTEMWENIHLDVLDENSPKAKLLKNYVYSTVLPMEQCEAERKCGLPKPVYCFHKTNCTDFNFFNSVNALLGNAVSQNDFEIAVQTNIKSLDSVYNKQQCWQNFHKRICSFAGKMPTVPQVIVVSTGDDYRNIRIANTLIQQTINKTLIGQHEVANCKQYIIVNVWDRRNNSMLVCGNGKWNPQHDVLENENLVVIVVGNNDAIYSCETTINQRQFAEDNFIRGMFNDLCTLENEEFQGKTWQNCIADMQRGMVSSSMDGDTAQFTRCLCECFQSIMEAARGNSFTTAAVSQDFWDGLAAKRRMLECEYDALDMWKRASGNSAREFFVVLRKMCKKAVPFDETQRIIADKKFLPILAQLCRVEHDRWLRYYIANGWAGGERLDRVKHHNSLAEFEKLDADAMLHRLENVLLAVLR